MNRKFRNLLFLSLGLIVGLSSCEDNNTPQKPDVEVPSNTAGTNNVKIKRELSNELYTYFSLKENKQLENFTNEMADESLNWDIAVLGANIKVNGGLNAKGKAAVYKTNRKDFDNIVSAAEFIADKEGWKENHQNYCVILDGTMPPPGKFITVNPYFETEKYFDTFGHTDIRVRPNVYIIRLASGNEYVKLRIKSIGDGSLKDLGNVEFDYSFIKADGKNPAVKEDDIVDKKPKAPVYPATFAEYLKDEMGKGTTKLVVPAKYTLKDEDFAMIESYRAITELDLTEATIETTKFLNENKSVAKVHMPRNLKEIGMRWFTASVVTDVIFTGTELKTIKERAFESAQRITKLVIPEGVTSVGTYSFSVMSSLTYIELPSTVTVIPEECFSSSLKLERVILKGNIKSIGDYAFWRNHMKEVDLSATPTPPTGKVDDIFLQVKLKNEDNTPFLSVIIPKGAKEAYKTGGWAKLEANFKEKE